MANQASTSPNTGRGKHLPLVLAGSFLLAHAVLPLWLGDVYPFTSAPMFRDSPRQYCNYRVFAADGRELPAEDFLVQRIYDGNPLGYGVGIEPPAILERFGEVRDEAAIRRHIQHQLARPEHRRHSYVVVEQEVVGPVDDRRVGVVKTQRWRVERTR